MSDFTQVASDEAIGAAVQALEANNFKVTIVADAVAAKDAALTAIPKGAEVFTVTSKTLDEPDIRPAINDSGDYDAVFPKMAALMNDNTKKAEQRRLSAAPEYVIGSVHAVTQDGRVLVASATGSQLPAYTYGADNVVWIVGAQKIVNNMDEAFKRLEQHVFPLEDERAQQAYGIHSSINKVVLFNKESASERIHIIIVKEALGF